MSNTGFLLKDFDFRNTKPFFFYLTIFCPNSCALYDTQKSNMKVKNSQYIYWKSNNLIVTSIILYVGYFHTPAGNKVNCKIHLLQNGNVYFTDRYFIWQSNFHLKDVIYCSVKLLGTFSGWNIQVTNLWHNNLCSRIWFLSSFLKIQKEKSTPFRRFDKWCHIKTTLKILVHHCCHLYCLFKCVTWFFKFF